MQYFHDRRKLEKTSLNEGNVVKHLQIMQEDTQEEVKILVIPRKTYFIK